MQKLLPDISNDELSNLLLSSVASPAALLQVDKDALDGLLGPEAANFNEAAEPLPAEVKALNQEFQTAAHKVRQKKQHEKGPWRGPPGNEKWSREVFFSYFLLKKIKHIAVNIFLD